MSDLISRQDAIEAVGLNTWAGSRISKLPADAVVRKRGEWLDNETSYSDDIPQTCTCSICGIRSRRPIGDFCKWCGADMREKENE